MVEQVGSLELVATLNTKRVEEGFNRLKGQMGTTGTDAIGLTGTMNNLGKTLSGPVSMGLTAGVGLLSALGLSSSTAAPYLTEMGITAWELGETMGGVMQPALESVSGAFKDFTGWVNKNKTSLDAWGVILGGAIGLVGELVKLFADNPMIMTALESAAVLTGKKPMSESEGVKGAEPFWKLFAGEEGAEKITSSIDEQQSKFFSDPVGTLSEAGQKMNNYTLVIGGTEIPMSSAGAGIIGPVLEYAAKELGMDRLISTLSGG